VLKNIRQERSGHTAESSRKASQSSDISSVLQQGRVLVLRDSSDHQFITEIIPSGLFHYSPAEGFTGTASSIRISGRMKTSSSQRDSLKTVQTLKISLKSDSSGQQKSGSAQSAKTKQVERKGWTGYWWVGLVGIVSVAGCFLYKKTCVSLF
ncbi:hypothetical protein, partial [Pararcticibacter amylolyticus]